MLGAEFLEQFRAPFQLAVPRVLHFDPVTRGFLRYLVRWILPLADNPLQVHRNNLLKHNRPSLST
jgi:hypothetical protein